MGDKNFRSTLLSICDWKGKTVFEAGVGTGRVTAIYADSAGRIIAADRSAHMIKAAKENLAQYSNKIEFAVKDNFSLSELAVKADIFIEGWACGHAVCDKPDTVEQIVETLGTGNEDPTDPSETLERFYKLL